jgi:hypothetical protein
MRKVVDSNFLQSAELRTYLADSRNYAVITDYAAMEAYKGDTLASIFRSMEILAEHSEQVIILKHTQAACALLGDARSQESLIDWDQTRGFVRYCRQLAAAKRGDPAVQREILNMGREATAHMDRMLADVRPLPGVFDEIARTFSPTQLAAIRKGTGIDFPLIDMIMKFVMQVAGNLFSAHPAVDRVPGFAELPNTFIFRYALCGFLLALRWISVGGAKGVRPERIRNDMVDMTFAAYATYFDGILTKDEKLSLLHREASGWLRLLIPEAAKLAETSCHAGSR